MDQFPVRAAAYERDDGLNTEVLVLAEREDGSGRRLEIQRALVVTDQDRDLNHGTSCLVSEIGACHYGGLRSWSLDDEGLHLELSEEAARDLGTGCHFVLPLLVPAAMRRDIETGLHRITE